jgi:hypothetical protein
MAWSMLVAFSQTYSENQEQKAEWKVQSGQKRSQLQVVEDVVAKEISAHRKKPSTLHWDHRKESLRVCQELTRPHPLQA